MTTIAELRCFGREALRCLTALPSPSTIPAETVALEVDLLLGKALECSLTTLVGSPGKAVSAEEAERFRSLIARRARGEPIAYIFECREFYGREFIVTPDVLIPRPETELLVERSVALLSESRSPTYLIDIGTGSGAIAISILAELCRKAPRAAASLTTVGSDISRAALHVAQRNAQRLLEKEELTFVQGDLLTPFRVGPCWHRVIVSNPPYVPEGEILPIGVEQFEPRRALRAGVKGLDVILRLLQSVGPCLGAQGVLLVEIGDGQASDIESAAKRLGYRSVEFHRDLSGIERVVEVRF